MHYNYYRYELIYGGTDNKVRLKLGQNTNDLYWTTKMIYKVVINIDHKLSVSLYLTTIAMLR